MTTENCRGINIKGGYADIHGNTFVIHEIAASIILDQQPPNVDTFPVARLTPRLNIPKHEDVRKLEYFVRAKFFIHLSFGRTGEIDLDCKALLKESSITLGLPPSEACDIDSQILQDYRDDYKKLVDKSQRFKEYLPTEIAKLGGDEAGNRRMHLRSLWRQIDLEGSSAAIVFNNYGNELLKGGNLEMAVICFEEAISIYEKDSSAYNSLAYNSSAYNSSAYVGLGVIRYQQGSLADSLKFLRKAKSLYEQESGMSEEKKKLNQYIEVVEQRIRNEIKKKIILKDDF